MEQRVMDINKEQKAASRIWPFFVGAVLFIVMGVFSTQAFSAGITVTAAPLQNAGGDLTFTSDWSSASAIVTRHEASTSTINGSDQITGVTVDGTKASGASDVTVQLLDTSQSILDTGTASLSTSAGTYNQLVTLTGGTIKYSDVVTINSSYVTSGPVTLTLNLTEGWDNGASGLLSALGTLSSAQTSDNSRLTIGSSAWTSFEFDQTVPNGATIVSAKVYVEHYEDNGFKDAELLWEIGTGTLSSPTVLGSSNPGALAGASNEAVVEWDVSTWIDTEAEANDIKLKINDNNTKGKATYQDYVYVVIEYNP